MDEAYYTKEGDGSRNSTEISEVNEPLGKKKAVRILYEIVVAANDAAVVFNFIFVVFFLFVKKKQIHSNIHVLLK